MLKKGIKLLKLNVRHLQYKMPGKISINKNICFLKIPIKKFSSNFEDENLFEKLYKELKHLLRKGKYFYRNNKNICIGIGILLGCILFSLFYQNFFLEKLNYSEFLFYLEKGDIQDIQFINYHSSKYNYCLVKINNKLYRLNIFNSEELKLEIYKKNESLNNKIKVTSKNVLDTRIIYDNLFLIFQMGILIGVIYYFGFSKGENPLNFTSFQKSSAQKFVKETNIKIGFRDVAGMSEEKREISEFVDFLTKPEKFTELGAKIPKGALLAGPPGTGKTLLAKACAGEANVNFYYTSGSEFVEMFVGVGAARVRDLFKEARENAPAIIFLDEIDAIGKKRGTGGSNTETDSTLNQLLVEMDGFGTKENVIVFGATNRKELLDSALTRPGRFDRIIDVNLPDLKGREEIFMVHLRPLKMEKGMKLFMAKRLSSLTPGFSGADIANICNEAAILAVRKNHDTVEKIDFEMAVERIIGGLEKSSSVSDEERKTVAVHESGHGVVSWFLKGADPLLKLTIIPRSKGALGFAQYLPKENGLQTKQELEDKIIAILAGRCAEEEFFGKVTTGAFDDFQKAYRIAHSIVTKLGMNEKMGYVSLEENQQGYKIYSDETNREIDKQCMMIIKSNTEKCRSMVKLYRNKIEEMSNKLLEQETIDLPKPQTPNPKPQTPNPINFKAYLEESL